MPRNWRIFNVDDQWSELATAVDWQLLRPAATLDRLGVKYSPDGTKDYALDFKIHQQYEPFRNGIQHGQYPLGWSLGSLSHAWEILELLESKGISLDICFLDIKLDIPQSEAALTDVFGLEDLTAPRRAFRQYIEQTQALHLHGDFHDGAGREVLKGDLDLIRPRGGVYLAARIMRSAHRFGNPDIYFYTASLTAPKQMFPFLYAYDIRVWHKNTIQDLHVIKKIFRRRQDRYLLSGAVSQSCINDALKKLRHAHECDDNESLTAALNMPIDNACDGWTFATFFAPQLWFSADTTEAKTTFEWDVWKSGLKKRAVEIEEVIQWADFGETATRFFCDGAFEVITHSGAAEDNPVRLRLRKTEGEIEASMFTRRQLRDNPDHWSPVSLWKSMPPELTKWLVLDNLEEQWNSFIQNGTVTEWWERTRNQHRMRANSLPASIRAKWGVTCKIDRVVRASFSCGADGGTLFRVLDQLFGESRQHANPIVELELRGAAYRDVEARLQLRCIFSEPWDARKVGPILSMPGQLGDCLRACSAWFRYRLYQTKQVFDFSDGTWSPTDAIGEAESVFEIDFYGILPLANAAGGFRP